MSVEDDKTPRPVGSLDTLPGAAATTISEPDLATGGLGGLTFVDRAHYEVIGEFARGGLGRILRARDKRTGRIVAIKEVLRSSQATTARFAFEAIVTANLQHPSTVPVYEVGRWPSGEPFYAMKLVSGRSLEDLIAETRGLRERVALLPHLIAVAEALAYAHNQKIIHRDLKPANVLVGAYGETVVIDWGLAKNLATGDEADIAPSESLPTAHHGATILGTVLGTPAYMSPEQARAQSVDERTDVYAIGAMLYQVLAGVRPFAEATTPQQVLDQVVVKPPRPLAEIDEGIPAELVAIVEKAMALRAADRYPTAQGLAEDLKRFTTGQLVSAHHYSLWALVRRFVRQNRAVVTASAIAAVLLIVFGTYSIRRIVAERNAAEAARRDAESHLAELFAEQGRQSLAGGEPYAALAYLGEAMRHGDLRPSTRFLVGQGLELLEPLEAVLVGHERGTINAHFSRDGRQVLASGTDGTVALWDLERRRPVRAVFGGDRADFTPDQRAVVSVQPMGPSAVVALWNMPDLTPRGAVALPGGDGAYVTAVSRDGARLAAGGYQGRVAWWRTDTLAPLAVAAGHADQVWALDFSPDGRYLASAGGDGVAKLWNPDGTLAANLVGHSGPIYDVKFSPDGALLATASKDATVMLWDVRLGALRARLAGHTTWAEKLAWDPDGRRLASGSIDTNVMVWDVTSGQALLTLKSGSKNVNSLIYSQDGARIVSGDEDGTVKVWNAQSGALEANFAGSIDPVSEVELSADGSRVVVAGLDPYVRVWRLDSPPPLISLAGSAPPVIAGGFSPDGRRVATSGNDDIVRVWDADTGRELLALAGHAAVVQAVEFSPDGTRLLSASKDHTARLWDSASGAPLAVLAGHGERVRSAHFDAAGERIVTASYDKTVRVWDGHSGALLRVLEPLAGALDFARFSPDGTRIVAGTESHEADLFEAATGKRLLRLVVDAKEVLDVDFSPDGTRFTLASTLSPPRVYRTSDGQELFKLEGHAQASKIPSVKFAARGDRLVSAGGDGTARLWNAADGGELASLTTGDAIVMSARFRPDDAMLATGGDKVVAIWDVASRRQFLRAPRDLGQVYTIHYSPDGTRLLILPFTAPASVWRIGDFTGSADELSAKLRCYLPVQVKGSGLAPAVPDCSAR